MNITTVAGIDCGSETTKVALWAEDETGLRVGPMLKNAGGSVTSVASRALDEALAMAGLPAPRLIIATGSMASKLKLASTQVPESTCLARGINRLSPESRTVVDAGAAKVLVVKQKDGMPVGMRHSDRCAGGAGSYLSMAAEVLGTPVADLGEISMRSTEKVSVQSVCAVFAETEIISLIHAGKKQEDIANGIALSCANRIFPLLNAVGWEKEVAIVGGTAGNQALVRAISNLLKYPVIVPENYNYCLAAGAALVAREQVSHV